ncbi:MAG: hypothetical protein PHW52_03685 [Candidatus Pacebacteria bacterium]|nr:hypothetical protein [Candidatus Paceibacterota bacterium]
MTEKIVFVRCKVENGKFVIPKRCHIPFGYHHLLLAYPDGTSYLLAAFGIECAEDTVLKFAEELAVSMGMSFEVDDSFYE